MPQTPATGEKTPKRRRQDVEPGTIIVTPAKAGIQEEAIQALIAAFSSEATTAAAAAPASTASSRTTSSSSYEEDAKFDYDSPNEEDNDPTVQKPPTVPKCSLQSLPTAFTTFADTISKKVQALLMQKRAKTKVSEKLRSKSFIPASLKTKFELTSSKEVRGSTRFFDLAAAASPQ
jgi:hypothetical protein